MAVHVLALLAHRNGVPVCSEVLAGSVNTNPVVVRRLLRELQKARLVQTRKGAGFGSRLGRPANRIDLGQIFRALECDVPFARPRREPNADCPVGRGIGPVIDRVFSSAGRALERDLARTTLAAVLAELKAAGTRKRGEARPKAKILDKKTRAA